MLKNKEVIELYMADPTIVRVGSNIHTTNDGRLFSYNTCIVQYSGNGIYCINKTYYSNTTSRYLNMALRLIESLRNNFNSHIKQVVYVEEVPKNTDYLI